MDSHQLTFRRSDPAAQGDSLNKLMLAGLVAVLGYLEENGDKIVTKLSLKPSAPAPSTPSESLKR